MAGFSVEEVTSLGDAIAGASFDDSEWPDGMVRVRSALGGATAYLGILDAGRGTGDRIYGDCTVEFNNAFLDPQLGNPLVPQVAGIAPGAIRTDAALEGRAWASSLFYDQWCRPQNLHRYMQAKLLQHGDVIAVTGVLRSPGQPDFDNDDLALFEQLLPALHRAARLRLQLGAVRLAGRADALEAMSTGLIVVDHRARLLYCNSAADRMLTAPSHPLDTVGGLLSPRRPADRDRLRRAIALASAGTPPRGSDLLLTPTEPDDVTLSIGIAPLPDAGLLGLPVTRAVVLTLRVAGSRPADFEARLAMLFALTAREAQLAGVLAAGGTLQDYVDDRGIGMPTGRSQLGALLRKTGTTRQGELLTLLLTALPPR